MPGSIRLFVTAPLAAGVEIAATAAQAHYLGTVMRRAVGEMVGLFNGRDGEWTARLATMRRGEASLVVDRMLRPQAAEPDMWLVFALLKRDATDLVVQKATELGVAALWPVLTARTNAQRVNLARFHAIAIEAAEQSERLTVPSIHEPQPLSALLKTWPTGRRLFVAAEREPAPPIAAPPIVARPIVAPPIVAPPGPPPGAAPPGAATTCPAALLVGPEGGFTPAELDAIRGHPLVTLVSLGPRILRAETAAIAGLARLQGAG